MNRTYMPTRIKGTPVTRFFCGEPRECLAVEISGEEYGMCALAAGDMWCSSKEGEFGKGLANSEDDPNLVERTGYFGQMAVGKLTGTLVDLKYHEYGDEYDSLLFERLTVDTKCATHNYGAVCVKVENSDGYRIPINKNIYIQSYVESEDRNKCVVKVIVVGFMTNKQVAKLPDKKPRKGTGHLNHELPFEDAQPFKKILDLCDKYNGERNAR